ncbi:hypothetical protein [Streptomyces sp. NPDC012510]|uniref:hypothetical protein n=1 Tax=Streptomyces sp. NPDC012510 TaxID=3364838 RepID=UPI0036E065F6
MCFTSSTRGARLARRLAAHRLDTWGHPYTGDANKTLSLITSELAANAVRHGHVAGRGLLIVATRASRWAVAPRMDGPGKTVWAEYALPGPGPWGPGSGPAPAPAGRRTEDDGSPRPRKS